MNTTYSKMLPLVAGLVCLSVLPAGCTSDEPWDEPDADASQTVSVPVSITLGSTYRTDSPTTRSAPPGTVTDPMNPTVDGEEETAQTNTVRIVAFRCKDRSDQTSTDTEGEDTDEAAFVYDPTNDQTVSCSRTPSSAHRLTAHGTLKKQKGYAYRVVALAYSTTRTISPSNSLLPGTGEEHLFSLNLAAGTTLADFQADLTQQAMDDWKEWKGGTQSIETHNYHSLSGQLAYAPQLFYGQCTSSTGSTVVRFRETDADGKAATDLPLTGVLYRGMAKVQLTLTLDKVSGTLQWIGLLANQTRTSVSLTDYDGFLRPFNPISSTWGTTSKHDTYTLVDFVDKSTADLTQGHTVTFTAWMLPTATRLAIRTLRHSSATMAGIHYPHNYPIGTAEYSSAEQGTGIISPDVVDGTFYLRRNQRYVLKGNLSTLEGKTELE